MNTKFNTTMRACPAICAFLMFALSANSYGDEAESTPSAEHPSVSPSNEQIVFSSNYKSTYPTLWLLDKNSGFLKKLVDWPDSTQSQPIWTPDGKYIVFVSTKGGGDRNIWRVNPDGSNPFQLTTSGDNRSPQLADNGSMIFYKTKQSKRNEYWLISLDGSSSHKADIPKGIKNPILSPDGTSIAYRNCNSIREISSYDERVCNIYKYNFTTGERTKLTHGDNNYTDINWGSNGIVYVSNLDDQPGIWLIDEFGNNPTLILSDNSFYEDPVWSVSGDSIIFSKTDSGSTDLWNVGLDGTQTKLSNLSIENLPPIADAGKDINIQCTNSDGALVYLDGTQSHDPDSDPLTYIWQGIFGTENGQNVSVQMPLGSHDVTLTVSDGQGGEGTDSIGVNVIDSTAPVISSISANPSVLWPVSHKMVDVHIGIESYDVCSSESTCSITSVTSNEPANSVADGNTQQDWVIGEGLNIKLRSERAGKGNDRLYTVQVTCTDSSQNVVAKDVIIKVPHNR